MYIYIYIYRQALEYFSLITVYFQSKYQKIYRNTYKNLFTVTRLQLNQIKLYSFIKTSFNRFEKSQILRNKVGKLVKLVLYIFFLEHVRIQKLQDITQKFMRIVKITVKNQIIISPKK